MESFNAMPRLRLVALLLVVALGATKTWSFAADIALFNVWCQALYSLGSLWSVTRAGRLAPVETWPENAGRVHAIRQSYYKGLTSFRWWMGWTFPIVAVYAPSFPTFLGAFVEWCVWRLMCFAMFHIVWCYDFPLRLFGVIVYKTDYDVGERERERQRDAARAEAFRDRAALEATLADIARARAEENARAAAFGFPPVPLPGVRGRRGVDIMLELERERAAAGPVDYAEIAAAAHAQLVAEERLAAAGLAAAAQAQIVAEERLAAAEAAAADALLIPDGPAFARLARALPPRIRFAGVRAALLAAVVAVASATDAAAPFQAPVSHASASRTMSRLRVPTPTPVFAYHERGFGFGTTETASPTGSPTFTPSGQHDEYPRMHSWGSAVYTAVGDLCGLVHRVGDHVGSTFRTVHGAAEFTFDVLAFVGVLACELLGVFWWLASEFAHAVLWLPWLLFHGVPFLLYHVAMRPFAAVVVVAATYFAYLSARWANRESYARYIGPFIRDADLACFMFPSLSGSSSGHVWRYVGGGMFQVSSHSHDRVVLGFREARSRPWLGPFVQDVTVVKRDDAFPLLCHVRFSMPYWSPHTFADVPPITESEDAACLYHPHTNEVELGWLGAAITYFVSAEAYRAAHARYRLANTKAYGVVAVALQDVPDQAIIAIAMSLIKSDVHYSGGRLPDPNNMPLYRDGCPEDAKPMGVKQVSSTTPYAVENFGCGAVMISAESERDTISRRIAIPRSEFTGNADIDAMARDFLDYVCGSAVLQPVDHDRVVEQMDRPSQRSNRAAVDTIMDFLPQLLKQLFTKREAVPGGKPARNICTVSPQRLYRAARYTIAAADHMQKHVWWVWGYGSGATSRKYRDSCASHPKMMESDFSKFDASLGPFWLTFNREFMNRLFPKDKEEIETLLADSEWQQVSTTLRQRFSYGCGRMSGVNETALFNTLDQAFVQYVAFRRGERTHEQAVALLKQSLFGGDDGIVPFVGQDLPGTAAIFGMKVTYRVFDNFLPCRFLGRIYLCGATSTDSVHDIADWLMNIHLVSCAGNTSVEQALVNTASGLFVTDRNTPIIRDFCNSVFRAYPHLTRGVHRNDEWWFKHYCKSDPFTLNDYGDDDNIIAFFATVMGVDVNDLVALADWFKKNDFTVGSALPVLEVKWQPKLNSAFMFYGIPFGKPEVAPELPRITPKEIERQMERKPDLSREKPAEEAGDGVEGTGLRPMSAEEKLVTVALFGRDDCHKCGQAGHYANDCPHGVRCRLCKAFGHKSGNCTAAAEAKAKADIEARLQAAADDDAAGMGIGLKAVGKRRPRANGKKGKARN